MRFEFNSHWRWGGSGWPCVKSLGSNVENSHQYVPGLLDEKSIFSLELLE